MKNRNLIENNLLRPDPSPVITLIGCEYCDGSGIWINEENKPEDCCECGGEGEIEIWR